MELYQHCIKSVNARRIRDLQSVMTLTAKIGKRGQMTLPRDVRLKYRLEEGQSVAFVVKNGELTLVPLRKTLFDFKGAVQPRETSDLEAIRERVAADQAVRVAKGE